MSPGTENLFLCFHAWARHRFWLSHVHLMRRLTSIRGRLVSSSCMTVHALWRPIRYAWDNDRFVDLGCGTMSFSSLSARLTLPSGRCHLWYCEQGKWVFSHASRSGGVPQQDASDGINLWQETTNGCADQHKPMLSFEICLHGTENLFLSLHYKFSFLS